MARHTRWLPALALLLAACTATVTPAPSPTPSPAPTPSPSPTPTTVVSPGASSSDPFAGQPYTLVLPPGWVAYDPSSPASKAALDAAAKANPNLAGPIQAFTLLPNLRMAVNQLLGNAMIVVPIPSNGIPLDVIGQSLTAQFQALLGKNATVDPPTKVSLPAGDALHWILTVSAANPSGGVYQVDESIYLLANSTTALLVEFAIPHGAAVPDEPTIVRSIRFVP